jgi:hypothetical protein
MAIEPSLRALQRSLADGAFENYTTQLLHAKAVFGAG